ncbi:MAG: tRNA lysidine(34) synthetase TilS [Lachnospiraceae bacterium]|nr:tRNA lysidine(34) synthetase TilS [Lachnospiraceae bacterium]
MKKRLIQFNEKHHLFEKGSKIVAGVSGGADSVCLLHLLHGIQEEYGLTLYVLHVHHGIRGAEAERDARFVRQLAGRMGLPFCLVRVDAAAEAKERGMTMEEAGRYLRYEALEQYRQQMGADRIALAHHRDDQAETVLFHLFRGTGPRGLAGMPVQRGVVIRPLLFAGREEIENYLEKAGLDCCQDSTNQETVYARNKIRLELLPFVEQEINRQAGRHISQAAAKMAQWRRYIEGKGQQAFEDMVVREGETLCLALSRFVREDIVIQGEVLGQIFARLLPGARDLEQVHYEQVLRLTEAESGRRLMLPGGMTAEKNYDRILFFRKEEGSEIPKVCVTCDVPCQHIVNSNGISSQISLQIVKREDLPKEIPQKDYTKWFDYDKINNELILRNPREGDFFVLNTAGARKKLSRYYMDEKIPKHLRGSQLVLAEESHVLWAIPGRISEAYKVSENTKQVLVVTKERIRHERRNQCID